MKNKVKKIICTLVIVTLFSFSAIQTLAFGLSYTKTISGYVKDVHGAAIENARVDLQENLFTFPPTWNNVKTVYTNSQGFYTLTYTGSARFYNLKVSKANYITQNYPIMWRDNNPITKNFQLATIFPIITTFQGYIYDDVDLTPVYGVLVKLYKQSGSSWSLERFMTTDIDGHYSLTSDSANSYPTYRIEVSRKCIEQNRWFYPTYSRTYDSDFTVDACRGYAIIIGISSFEDPYIETLASAESQAYGWYDFLKNKKGFKEFIVFRDDHINLPLQNDFEGNDRLGTQLNIYLGVTEIANKADSNDMIAFIQMTHGHNALLTMFYFDAYDTQTVYGVYNPLTCVMFPDMLLKLAMPKCNTFIYLDSCHSGEGKYDHGFWMNDEAFAKSYLVTACQPEETASFGFYYKYFFSLSYLIYPYLSLEEIFDLARTYRDPNNSYQSYYDLTGCIPMESDGNVEENTYL